MHLVALQAWCTTTSPPTIVYVGTYTGDGPTDSKGIYAFQLDSINDALIPLGLAAAVANPSYVLPDPTGKFIYAVSEQDDGKINSFSIDRSQVTNLKFLNQKSSLGSGPCYLSTDKMGRFLFVANYNNGTVAVLPIDSSNGFLKDATGFDQQYGSSVNPDRQTSAHAHSIRLDPNGEFALSADLGSDQIYHYLFSSVDGSLTRNAITKAARDGDGPRHLIFSKSGNHFYLINELSSTINVYNYTNNVLQLSQIVSTLPSGYTLPNTGAEILLHPVNENFLYASNRGHNSIAVFAVNQTSGFLTLNQHMPVQGQTPRNFNISPDGKYLIVANQDSNNIVLFRIDSTTGSLSFTGSAMNVSKPTCVKYLV